MPMTNDKELEKAKDTLGGPIQGPADEGLTEQPKHTEAWKLEPILPSLPG